ncbi:MULTISPECIES: tryptophan halogenase family protein [Kitasatospora]|uniref:Tryptophan 7-halogenase n=1 Tax=Kitasatospora cathayae TaxID=3004092 RepID=A0ABY7QDX8_9ACTN|nr:tryptophan halogenase family protein [Kitasatospora sp. HUAS 3-15]WBP90916.1 tryptophan 7-halogenase [Kitasatospora sp. HUAS 3-15]
MKQSVVVLGGGTAGWMASAYLRAAFGNNIDVTVVESRRIGTIGVGEATFSTVRHFFDYLGLSESDWMPECNATYKLAVRLEDWRAPGDVFYHPFERMRIVDGVPLTDWWQRLRPTERFDHDCFLIPWLCDAKASPRHLDGRLFEQDFAEDPDRQPYRTTLAEQNTQFPYAYHFDASLLADFLTRYAVERGVRQIIDDVVDVRLDERGWIDHLVTKGHGELRADLYVDCSGFRSRLLGQALDEPFISFQDALPNDRAVALRVPVDTAVEGIRPCTTATAQDAGWIWTIPLLDRIGTGYVYAADYCEPEEAERVLREFVGPAADGLEANHIRMRIGRSRRAWVNNCVGIGLSAGFVEPLQSTGIFLIQHAIEQLVRYFPGTERESVLRDGYNLSVARAIEGVREFLILHYRGAARADNDYWRDAKRRAVPDDMAWRLEQWQGKLPDNDTTYPYYHAFEPYSYVCMALGLGGIPLHHPPALDLFDAARAQHELSRVREQAQALLKTLPSQAEYLSRLR